MDPWRSSYGPALQDLWRAVPAEFDVANVMRRGCAGDGSERAGRITRTGCLAREEQTMLRRPPPWFIARSGNDPGRVGHSCLPPPFPLGWIPRHGPRGIAG